MTKILIVDDHQMFIDGLSALLIGQENFQVVAEANSGKDALEILENTEIDLMITDLSMPEMPGLELIKIAKDKYPHVKILVLSMHNNRETVGEILMSEAEGYILKNTGKQELLSALEKIADNGTFYCNEVLAVMIEKIKNEKKTEKELLDITERELEILKLICEENSSEQIANKLYISKRTVDTHRQHIYEKTGSKTIVSLMKFAVRNNLVMI